MAQIKGQTNALGRASRQRIEQALLGAGRDGITVRDLAALIGMSESNTRWHLAAMPEAVRAITRHVRHTRWFHTRHQADAQAYAARVDAIPVRNHGPSHATRMDLLRHIESSGRAGITVAALMLRTGLSIATVHDVTAWARKHHGVQRQRKAREVRFYGGGVDLSRGAPAASPARTPTAQQRAGLQAIVTQAPAGHGPRTTVTSSRPMTPPAASVANGLHGLTLAPGARIVVAQHRDPRQATAESAAPVFAALGPGRYLDHDNALARRYGQQPSSQCTHSDSTPPAR